MVIDAGLVESFNDGLKPPPDILLWEYADKHFYIPEEEPEPGLWRTSRVPYVKEILECLSPRSRYRQVVWMKGSQVAGTETAKILKFFHIDHDPCRILFMQPTIETVRDYSEEKFQKSVEVSERVKSKIGKTKAKDAKNRILKKAFPGGSLTMVGANSPNPLAAKSIRILIFDDKDRYRESVGFQGAEGSPVELAIKRTTNFPKSKVYSLSTPTVAGTSYIEEDFEKSDKRYYYVPCPFCKEKQIIKWRNIKFKRNDNDVVIPDSVHLECEHCKEKIKEHHKTWMLENGEWRKHAPESKIAGFHLSALYSPLGWYAWHDPEDNNNAVDKYLDAIGNPEKMKVWVNTVLGETFDPSMESISHNWLMKRRKPFGDVIPEPVIVLTAGVDLQIDRIEVSTVGWGLGEQSFVCRHDVLPGDPEVKPDVAGSVWELLDQFLLKTWQMAGAKQTIISCACIDSGYATDNVYEFCKPREFRRIFATKGIGGPGRPIVGKHTRNNRRKCALIHVGTDQAKDMLYARLKISKESPGYIHFPDILDEEYFKQLTAEKKIKKTASGMPFFKWELPQGKKNETLDCYILSMVAFKILPIDLAQYADQNIIFKPDYNKTAPPRVRGIRGKGAS